MAKSNAQRQAEHRAKQRETTDRHQLNTFITHESWARLQQLAKRDGVTAAEVLETLLRNAMPVLEVAPKAPAPSAGDRLEAKGQERLF